MNIITRYTHFAATLEQLTNKGNDAEDYVRSAVVNKHSDARERALSQACKPWLRVENPISHGMNELMLHAQL